MKNKKFFYYFLMFLPLMITAVALLFLPEQIPAHYNFAGEIDRWGSKYESLIFPFITIAMGFFMLWMAKISSKSEDGGTNNEKVVFYTGMGISLWFTVMHCYSLYNAFKNTTNLNDVSVDINQLFCILLGIGLVIIGNFMPKLRKNSVIGLRTVWSMKNDDVWKKCQRFSGISLMIGGFFMIVTGIFIKGVSAMFITLGILFLCMTLGTVYSYIEAIKTPAD